MLRRLAPLASIALALAAAALGGCATVPPPLPASGAVSAADPRAQAAGEAMLRQGGNAADAAIAAMLALTVVEPQSSGIGGGGLAVRGTADGRVTSYDGRETAPAGATPDWFLVRAIPPGQTREVTTGPALPPPFEASVRSGRSVGVPGNVALAAKLHAEHGRLPWAALFAPAIALARDGFAVTPRLNTALAASRETVTWAQGARAPWYGADGAPAPVGSVLRQPELAATLEAVAAGGREAFYAGPLAAEIAATVAARTPRAGAMTPADLASYAAKERPAICGEYRRHRVCSMGPPTSGGVAVIQMLGMLERFDLAALGVRNPVTWHLFAEAQRLAYADRERYLADSDFVSVPVTGLIAADYLAQRSALIDPARTLGLAAPGTPAGAAVVLADGDAVPENGTSHIAATDAEGTMVSYTSTVEGPFGSGLMAGGFFLNNELTDFSRTPAGENGVPVANRVEGGKRPRSSMAPVVVWDPEGRPFLVVGAAGGATIPVQTARSVIGAIDFGLDAEGMLGMPFLMQMGATLAVEQGTWLEGAIPALIALGHEKVAARSFGLKGGAVLRTGAGWQTARDPRVAGAVVVP